jgi:anti-sigma B factor antagonist
VRSRSENCIKIQIVKDPLNIYIEHRDGVTVLAVGSAIDLTGILMFETAVAGVLSEDLLALVIDLSEVPFIDSSGLRILVRAREKIGESAPFAVVAQGPIATKIIRLLNLQDLLSLHETLPNAMAAVKERMRGGDSASTA